MILSLTDREVWAYDCGGRCVKIERFGKCDYICTFDGEVQGRARNPQDLADQIGAMLQPDGRWMIRLWERTDKRNFLRQLGFFLIFFASILFSLILLTEPNPGIM